MIDLELVTLCCLSVPLIFLNSVYLIGLGLVEDRQLHFGWLHFCFLGGYQFGKVIMLVLPKCFIHEGYTVLQNHPFVPYLGILNVLTLVVCAV